MIFLIQIMSVLASFSAKLSVLLLYLRAFSVQKILRYFIFFGIAFNFCLNFALFIINLWFCTPRPGAAWDMELGEHCERLTPIYVVSSALNIALDLYILLLPCSTFFKLQLPLRKKIGLMIVFMTGIM